MNIYEKTLWLNIDRFAQANNSSLKEILNLITEKKLTNKTFETKLDELLDTENLNELTLKNIILISENLNVEPYQLFDTNILRTDFNVNATLLELLNKDKD